MTGYKKSAETCKRILASAEELFCEKGYAATTTREIADRAGISRGNLTYHYPNKSDIAREICTLFYASFFDEIKTTFADIDDIILRDSIHVDIQMKLLMLENEYMSFYHELDRYHIQSSLSVEMNYSHFVEQAEYLGLDFTKADLISCATIFPTAMMSLIHAVRRKSDRIPPFKAVEMLHRVHLNLLRIEPDKIEEYIALSREYTAKISWEVESLTRVKLKFDD